MCLLVILYRVCRDAPVVVAANREEFYARGGDPPQKLDSTAAVAGIDPSHGGTWLGVNAHGVLIAVTNRFKTDPPLSPRSRGLLARELLGSTSAKEATLRAARSIGENLYAGCNFLCADADSAAVVHGGDWLRVRPLPAGVHVLSNRDVNDPSDRRVQYALNWLAHRDLSNASPALDTLAELCKLQEPGEAPMCFRRETRGSVASSLIALRESLADGTFRHAQGPPDVTPYTDISPLLRELAETQL